MQWFVAPIVAVTVTGVLHLQTFCPWWVGGVHGFLHLTLAPCTCQGAAEEGQSLVRWSKSLDGHVFYDINKNGYDASGRNSTLYLSADLTHHYIRVLVVPIGKDGARGKPSHSKLVYINVDDGIDKTVRDLVLKGEVAFKVRANRLNEAKNVESGPVEQQYVIHMDGKKMRVCKSISGDKATREVVFALIWSGHIQVWIVFQGYRVGCGVWGMLYG